MAIITKIDKKMKIWIARDKIDETEANKIKKKSCGQYVRENTTVGGRRATDWALLEVKRWKERL